jgi:hypothetical protein
MIYLLISDMARDKVRYTFYKEQAELWLKGGYQGEYRRYYKVRRQPYIQPRKSEDK